jgi:hypothetical protein
LSFISIIDPFMTICLIFNDSVAPFEFTWIQSLFVLSLVLKIVRSFRQGYSPSVNLFSYGVPFGHLLFVIRGLYSRCLVVLFNSFSSNRQKLIRILSLAQERRRKTKWQLKKRVDWRTKESKCRQKRDTDSVLL